VIETREIPVIAGIRCSSATTIRLITVDSKELEEILM